MRYRVSLFAGLLFPLFILSQSAPLPLNFKSYAIKLCVAKDESLVLTTKAGEVGLAKSKQSEWRRSEPGDTKELFGLTLEQPNFFNKDTGFVSGYINSDGKYDIIYHTINGGEKWRAIGFGQSGWIDDAINLDNGEAWLSVAGSGIAYTSDHGFTWKKLKIPEVKQRFTNIFFNSRHHGIIGSLWNLLAYTNDNCKTWILLPTPLDQKAYSKTSKDSRPAFNRVAIVDDLLLVKQEELVFYTKRDSIKWIWLKQYDDFYTDPANSAVYLKTTKGNIIRTDNDLNPLHDYNNVINGYDSKCKNGSLFIVSKDRIQQLDPDNQITSYLFTINGESNVEPVTIGYTGTGTIGVLNGKAYSQKEYNGKWDHIFDFPFPVDDGSLSLDQYNLILYDRNDDSLFYIDLSGKEVLRRSKTKMIADFCKEGIKELRFNKGSQGCFHHYQDELSYNRQNGIFISQGEESTGSKHKANLPDNEEEINDMEIIDFVSKIPSLFHKANRATIGDLGFTEQDYKQCKQDILDFKESLQSKKKKATKFSFYKNNIDFDRLLSLVDSIKYLDPQRLNKSLYDLEDVWSTTTFWTGFQLINNKSEVLSVTSRYYGGNSFYFPWIISLNGYSFTTTNIEVNRFLEKVYPSFLGEKDPVAVLHILVQKLY